MGVVYFPCMMQVPFLTGLFWRITAFCIWLAVCLGVSHGYSNNLS